MEVRVTNEDLLALIGQKEVEKFGLQKQIRLMQEHIIELEKQIAADQGDPA